MAKITLAYGSESGNAKRLAHLLSDALTTNGFAPKQFDELNAISLKDLNTDDTLLVITSSFGDGEPTGNACEFHEKLIEAKSNNCQFAVFGLGDVSYPEFCGFSIEVDTLLREKGAQPIAQRVDADTDYQAYFDQWSSALMTYFSGDSKPLQALDLQVKSYSENQSFPARVKSVTRSNSGDFPAYDISIGISGSGMSYQAGDLLYLVAPVNKNTLSRINQFYETLTDSERATLSKKELRNLSKPLIRALAKITKNTELKAMTKFSASKQLADYCYGKDVADVLNDFCTVDTLPISDLIDSLSEQLPRAYSIASCGITSPETIRLCVREVAYRHNDNEHVGTASHFLSHCAVGSIVNIYVRANPHFHLPKNDNVPIMLIGAGVGIAPHLGFLAQLRQAETHLFFGDRNRDHDFLYREELEGYLQSGHLTTLNTAFSRDQTEKIYVTTIVLEQGQLIWDNIQNSGEIYVCGSKKNLSKSLDSSLLKIAKFYGNLNEDEANKWLYDLDSSGRYHKDLY